MPCIGLSTDEVLEALSAAKVPRSAVPLDLRDLVVAGKDPREAARELADHLRRCPFLPEQLVVHVGELDESTGKIALIENGDALRTSRLREEAGQVLGYTPGPHVEKNDGLPPLEGSPPQQLAPANSGAPPPPSIPPIVVVSRLRNAIKATPADLKPEFARAIQKIRTFMEDQIPKAERKKILGELAAAKSRGKSSEDLTKIALHPILKSGDRRYQVVDELMVVKEGLAKLSSEDSAAVLIGMVR